MREITVGVVGVGHVGFHHARIYRETPGVDLVGVVDVNPDRLREVTGRLGVRGYASSRDLLGRVQAVSIAVPTRLHAPIAAEFLREGADVLVEKPISDSVPDAEELVEIARRGGRILQVGHSERFNAVVREARSRLDSPRFIECHRLGPFVGRGGTDVDVILDLMIHDIDIVVSLLRSPLLSITAVGVPVITDQVDVATARLEFSSGCVANLTASRVSGEKVRRTKIFQRETYLSLDYASQEVTLYRPVSPSPGRGGERANRMLREPIPVVKGEPLKLQIHDFVAAVKTRRPPTVTGEEGVEALRVAAQILQKI